VESVIDTLDGKVYNKAKQQSIVVPVTGHAYMDCVKETSEQLREAFGAAEVSVGGVRGCKEFCRS